MMPIAIICLLSLTGVICQVQAITVFFENFSDAGSNTYNTSSTTGWNRGNSNYLKNLSLVDGKLEVKYVKNSHHGGWLSHYFGGLVYDDSGSFWTSETQYDELYLKYDFKFQEGFEIQNNKTGKMPGLAGRRNGGWGCKKPGWNGYEGWSARMSFKEIGDGEIQLIAYPYHYDIPSEFANCGENIVVGTLDDNTWYTIKMYVKMNTVNNNGGINNGILRVWLNDELEVNRTNMKFIDDTSATITELWLDNYFGGGNKSPQTQYVYIDNVIAATTEMGVSIKPVVAQPTGYYLHENYPNPFNPETTISFRVPQQSFVKVRIYDEMGQHIATLLNAEVQAGYHMLRWNGTDNNGRPVADGVYFYKMEADEYIQSKKMLLLK